MATARKHQYIADYTARALGAMLFGLGLHALYDPFAGASQPSTLLASLHSHRPLV